MTQLLSVRNSTYTKKCSWKQTLTNMEVTKKNFNNVLTTLPDVFKKAQFIAIDTEFTGLKVDGATNIHYFDTLEDLYLKNKLRAETFMAIQIGLIAFVYNEKTNEYSHTGYNFYVCPSSYSNINFTCQSKSIQFLVEHDFDFNKVFREGIPYLKQEDADRLLEKLTDKYEKKMADNYSTTKEIPSVHKPMIDNIISKIEGILQSQGKSSFTVERCNAYIRKLIYSSVEGKFGAKVHLESNKDDSMTVFVGFSTEEIKQHLYERFLVEKKKISDEVGFCKVVKMLIESKKLIIGHNVLLDLLFIIKQFLAPLPDTYSEFKELLSFLFPTIIDTKYMAATELKDIRDTSLNCVVEYFGDSFVDIPILEDGQGCRIKDEKQHEACFDAYLTGLCFIKMAEYIGKSISVKDIFRNLPESEAIKPCCNKVSVPRLHDISFMNLGGADKSPDRSGVYHLTFPKEWTRDDIMDLFKNYGPVNISWINSTSAFVKVKTELTADIDSKLIKQDTIYQLRTYSEYKTTNNGSTDVMASPCAGKRLETKTSNNHSPGTIDRKRKAEDIGEVIERPQKKQCSS